MQRLADGRVRWSFRESKTGKATSILLQEHDWMGRFLQHILPRGFARVRTFGWLHPAAKVRGNRVRALLEQVPLLSKEEQTTWMLPTAPELKKSVDEPGAKTPLTPCCPRCQKPMRLAGSWHGKQAPLHPERPP